MIRQYEVVYIFDSSLEEPQVNEHLDRFHELLKTPEHPEPITGMAHWGKRTLAYPIKKKEVGYYVVAHFETDTQLLNEFERAIKLNESVLRYLVVINEGLPADRLDLPAADDRADEDDDDLPRKDQKVAAQDAEEDDATESKKTDDAGADASGDEESE